MNKMIDTHAHLDMLKNKDDILESVNSLKAIITIGCDKEKINKAVELSKRFDNVFASIGFHPYDVNDISDKDIENLKTTAEKNSKVVAIGETGLDYYREITPKEKQVYFFERQLELAKELGLPVVIHSRSADEDTLKILEKHSPYPDSGVMHCFGGGVELMEKTVELGFYISFAGNITYPKADNLRNVLKKVPLDRLLIETDCPFLAPQKKRGKENKPVYLIYTLEFISEFLGIDKNQLEKITENNAEKLFKINKYATV